MSFVVEDPRGDVPRATVAGDKVARLRTKINIPCWSPVVTFVTLTAVMFSLFEPEVILTHESDLDGLVSGVLLQRLARHLFASEAPLEAYHFHNWRQRGLRERAAWVCDLSFEARLDRPNWLVVDHHPTELTPKHARLIHNLTKSAGLLCYELCQQHGLQTPVLDRLVQLNNVADLFLEDDPDFVVACDYANLVKTYGFWNLHALIKGDIEKLLDHPLLEVMAVKRKVENPLGLAWSKANIVKISPAVGFVDTVIGNNNLIVHELLERQATPFPVLLTLFRRANGMIIASVRSRNGEALKVAEQLHGGGHANACGATLPRLIQTMPEAVDYLRKVLDPAAQKSTPLNSLEGLFDAIETKSN